MYKGLVFTGYIAALCFALIGVSLIVLILMKNRKEQTGLFKSVRLFSFLILCLSVLYFYFFCREALLGKFSIPVIWRILDYVLFGAVVTSWIRVISKLSQGRKYAEYAALAVGGTQAVVGAFITAAFGDGYYRILNQAAGSFFTVFEAVLTLVTVILVIRYTVMFLSGEVDVQRKIFCGLNSVLLLLWCINQSVIDVGLYAGRYGVSAWNLKMFDPTAIIMTLMALSTLVYVFREDFSPIYFVSSEKNEYDDDTSADILSTVAEDNHLSVREFETMRLIYEGYSNLEIADELCIALSTVKKHAKNVYSKMGVSGRMDLVHFISEKEKNRLKKSLQ